MKLILGKLNGETLRNLALQAVPYCSEVDAAVAYATKNPFFEICKEHGLRLTFYCLLDESGPVSHLLLRDLLAWGPSRAGVHLVKGNFHAKVIWWRGFGAYVGSANLTEKAWSNNVEAGVFFDEDELASQGLDEQLDLMLDHLAKNSTPLIKEHVDKLEQLAKERRDHREAEAEILTSFKQYFKAVPDNPGLSTVPPKGQRTSKAMSNFMTEWTSTLQLMRGLREDFLRLGQRPTWVPADAHPAVHFDQFLHAYYYSYVREVANVDEDDERSGLDKVEASHAKNRSDTAAALKEAARWWGSLRSDLHGEAEFIRTFAPAMRSGMSRTAIATMDLESFHATFENVNAFRMHARQMSNTDLGLPPDYHGNIGTRIRHFCNWIWQKRSPTGKTVRDVLEFVIWGAKPQDMEERLWQATHDDEYRIPHFGQSCLGEAIGWARPDDYPPRNNRTNKALRALGHQVKLFSKS